MKMVREAKKAARAELKDEADEGEDDDAEEDDAEAAPEPLNAEAWTDEEQATLDAALAQFDSSLDAKTSQRRPRAIYFSYIPLEECCRNFLSPSARARFWPRY